VVNIILWLVPVLFFLYRIFIAKAVLPYTNGALLQIGGTMIVAIVCSILGNYDGWNKIQDKEARLTRFPSAPETDYYWLFS